MMLAFHVYAPFYCYKKANELKMNRMIAVFAGLLFAALAYLIYSHLSYKAKQSNKATN